MRLSELFLNRFLYREKQTVETLDSSYISANPTPAVITPVSSGSAAYDINTNYYTINGSQITPGTLILQVGDWGWGQTSVFTSASLNQVNWGAGTFKTAYGNIYSIGAGNTGVMAAKTYIYLDLNVSETAYQITTTPGDAVGIGKVVVAVAQNGATSATFNMTEANQIVGDNVLANSINASKLVAGSITATQMTAATINAMNIIAGSVAAENITGTYITGKIIRTASSGLRVQLDGTNYTLLLMRDNETFATLEPLYDGSSGSNGFNLTTPDGAGLSVASGGSFDFTSLAGYNVDIDMSGSNINYNTPYGSNVFTSITLGGVAKTAWGSGMTYPGSGIAVSNGSGWDSSITNNSSNWNNALLKSGGTMTGNITMPGATYYINFNGSYIDDVNTIYLLPRTTNPGAAAGAMYFNSLTGTVHVYDGSAWQELAYI